MWRLLIAVVPACSFTGSSTNLATSTDGQLPQLEAGPPPVEAGSIDASTLTCFGAGGLFVGCVQLPQPAMLMLTSDIDTDNDQRCVPTAQPNGPTVCMISSTIILVPGAVRVTGTKPLVLLATDSLTVKGGGTIDVSSATTGGTGAGFDATACTTGNAAGQFGGFGAGGAGGSFKTKGGAGGHAANGTASGATAGNNDVPTFVRGGCPGSSGADSGGAPGHGGGALYLLAANAVQIDGTLIANGQGGGGATGTGGGAGAGSGGLIGIMAAMIKGGGGARMFANGGGGGGGGSNAGGGAGGDGTATLSMQATPGTGGINAGIGGGGGVNTTMAAPGGDGQGGGGGGGGATGFIYFHGASTFGGQTSPPVASP